MAKLRSYHYAWLKEHPWRNEDWLCQRLADGFDVHHIDGDKSNEAPGNLVLIEHGDHMRMHSGKTFEGRLMRVHAGPRKTIKRKVVKIEKAKPGPYVPAAKHVYPEGWDIKKWQWSLQDDLLAWRRDHLN